MRVAILGCGYVGFELGRQLQEAGHDPIGVRRSDDGVGTIQDAGIDAVQADVTDADSLERIPDVAAVVFLASSGGRDAEAARAVYVDGLRTAIDHFGTRQNAPEHVVYTSSTGVYGDHGGGFVDETTPLEPTTEKTQVLADAEQTLHDRTEAHAVNGTVVRFAGLYGPDRYRLRRYVEGPVTAGYLNMIHRDDAAGVVRFALTDEAAGGQDVLLAVDDEPVDKWAFADWLTDECGVDRPARVSKAERLAAEGLSEATRRRLTTSKRCSNERLRELGYDYEYPTFREGYRDAIDAFRRGEYD